MVGRNFGELLFFEDDVLSVGNCPAAGVYRPASPYQDGRRGPCSIL